MVQEESSTPYNYDYDSGTSFTTFNWAELTPTLMVYSVTFLVGLCGNSLIIVATYRYRKMQSVTNILLASLASADLLLIVICIPVKLAKLFSYTWTMGLILCKLVHYMQNLSAICSVLTLTAISIERYYAILHPMQARYICTVSQARKVIAVTWILAILLATPVIFVQEHMKVGINQTAYWCSKNWENSGLYKAHELYMLLLVLIIPTIIMTYAYKNICFEVWKVVALRSVMTSREVLEKSRCGSIRTDNVYINLNDSSKSKSVDNRNEDTKTVRQVIHMLVAVVVLFAICWGPLLIENVLTAYEKLPFEKIGIHKYVLTAFTLMAYVNSCINPIIYGFMSKNFRDSFQSALCCFSRRWQRQNAVNTTNYSTRQISRSSTHTKHTSIR
ncbi:QRFP-like peptide receptor [Onthophagus taurus]|uniref:QRFP-like peptide receptor n=1 Tax=Onthophagus taurus TaxID=166361 RepID=UPI000C208A1A|nr:QRFP-like peptide receptor [Onthophagus taurus]